MSYHIVIGFEAIDLFFLIVIYFYIHNTLPGCLVLFSESNKKDPRVGMKRLGPMGLRTRNENYIPKFH